MIAIDFCDGTIAALPQGWYWRASLAGIPGGYSQLRGPYESKDAATQAALAEYDRPSAPLDGRENAG